MISMHISVSQLTSGNLQAFGEDLSRVLMIEVMALVFVNEHSQLLLCFLVNAISHDRVKLGHTSTNTYILPGFRASLRKSLMLIGCYLTFSAPGVGSSLLPPLACSSSFSSSGSGFDGAAGVADGALPSLSFFVVGCTRSAELEFVGSSLPEVVTALTSSLID